MKHNRSSGSPTKIPTTAKHKSEHSYVELPLLKKGAHSLMRDKWESLIKLTGKENVVGKGTTLSMFPKLGSKMV